MRYNTSLKEQSKILILFKYLYYIRTDLYLYFGGTFLLLSALELILLYFWGGIPQHYSFGFFVTTLAIIFVGWCIYIIIYLLLLKHHQRQWYWRFIPRGQSSLYVEIGENSLLFSPSRNNKNEYVYAAIAPYPTSIQDKVKAIDRIIEIDLGLFFLLRRPFCVLNGPILFVEKKQVDPMEYSTLTTMLKAQFKQKYYNRSNKRSL